jgi:hypothetical protein
MLRRLIKQFSDKVIENLHFFKERMPETVAIAILMAARKECKIEELSFDLENMLMISKEEEKTDIRNCYQILQRVI